MDDELLGRLESLCGAHAVSGYEEPLASEVARECALHADEVRTDSLGNVIARVRGEGPTVMVAAHLDEIGLMVRHIDERGFLFFVPVGGHRAQNLFARTCTVKTDDGRLVPGLINHPCPGRPRSVEGLPELEEFFVDVGATSREAAEEMGLEIGNTISLDYQFRRMGRHRVMGKAIDDRALVLIQLEVVRRLAAGGPGGSPDLYFVFTVQEEVGARGARTAAYALDPDVAIALDIAIANDHPGTPARDTITRLDAGPAIKVMDRLTSSQMGFITPPRVLREIKRVAEENGIPYQLEVYLAGSTDAATVHLEREGIATGAILLPTRYVHAHEVISRRDLENTVELLERYLRSLGSR